MLSREILQLIALLGVSLLVLNGCMRSSRDALLAEIGPEKMSIAEYERRLAKSQGSWKAAKNLPMAEKERFLDLLVKFRLKVLDAYRRGLHRDPETVQEMREYRNTLAISFLLDREIVAPGLRRMYERKKEEIRASHILIGLTPNPTDTDTLRAWQKASEILRLARAGEDFGKLAQQFSDDYTSRDKGGDVYYFSSGLMAPAFEDACYELQAGEIYPTPVRTHHGYHIIKVTERKKSRGQIRASHIMIRFETTSPSPDDTLKAYNQIKALEDSLEAGVDFETLAKRYSQDMGSAHQGGDLSFFERRQTVTSFDEVAFSLKVGQVSGVVRTPYGYHLIKVTDEKPVAPFREMRQSLRETYQNHRYMYDYNRYLQSYKSKLKFRYHDDAVDTLLSCADTTKVLGSEGWDQKISSTYRQKPVFSFAGQSIILDSVIRTMQKDQEFSKMELRAENIRSALDRLAEREILRYRTRDIESEYPDFPRALKEYEEGILLYKAEQQHVWSRFSTTDSLLRDYFEQNRERYTFPDRVNFSEIYIIRDSAQAAQILDSLKAGKDFGELAQRHTDRIALRDKKGEWGLRPVGENYLAQIAAGMEVGQVSDPLPFEEGYSIIKVIGKENARLKTYEEALPEVSSHYHDDMSARYEQEWLESLRKKFKVVVWKDRLGMAFTEPPREEDN